MIGLIVKRHKLADGRTILAVCDDDLLGKKFEEGDLQLDIGKFYDGEKKSRKEVELLFKSAYIVNLVGEDSVELGIKKGLVAKERVVRIAGIPYAEALC